MSTPRGDSTSTLIPPRPRWPARLTGSSPQERLARVLVRMERTPGSLWLTPKETRSASVLRQRTRPLRHLLRHRRDRKPIRDRNVGDEATETLRRADAGSPCVTARSASPAHHAPFKTPVRTLRRAIEDKSLTLVKSNGRPGMETHDGLTGTAKCRAPSVHALRSLEFVLNTSLNRSSSSPSIRRK